VQDANIFKTDIELDIVAKSQQEFRVYEELLKDYAKTDAAKAKVFAKQEELTIIEEGKISAENEVVTIIDEEEVAGRQLKEDKVAAGQVFEL
jgi:hypothetical protein